MSGRLKMGLSIVICLIILFSCVFANGASPSSRLELPIGFNLPVRASYMVSLAPSNYTPVTAAYDDGGRDGVFFPILSSEKFINGSVSGPGFSFGFFFNNVSDYNADHNVAVVTADIYLGVCVGRGIANKRLRQNMGRRRLVGRDDLHPGCDANWSVPPAPLVRSGYAVPVWVANSGRPLRSVNASLMVVDASSAGGSNKELQLQDYDGTVLWSVGNVGMIEMQDETGNLVIYDTYTSDNGRVVWQSSLQQPKLHALAAGQPFTVGMELVSDDSSYTLRMLPAGGGLAFYLNKHFVRQPTPYWVIPVTNAAAGTGVQQDLISDVLNPSSLINCPNNFLVSMALYIGPPDNKIVSYEFTERCTSQKLATISFPVDHDQAATPDYSDWSFSKLGNDGRLYVHTVYGNQAGLGKGYGLHLGSLDAHNTSILNLTPSRMLNFYNWGACDVPMACGPLGLCSPAASNSHERPACKCPDDQIFSYIDPSNPSQGCKRNLQSDYNCKSEGGSSQLAGAGLSMSFLELQQTATILIFNGAGWELSGFSEEGAIISAEECKDLCAFNCSCNGVFYVVDSASCFQMTDEISLLSTVINKTLFYFNYSSQSTTAENISANNYITYLKIIRAMDPVISMDPVITMDPAVIYISKAQQPLLLFKLLVALGVAFVLLVVLVQLLQWIIRRMRRRIMSRSSFDQSLQEEEQALQELLPMLPTRFSYEELHDATQAFTTLLGAGGCGSVYSGVLLDGRKVAVKILESLFRGQIKQFLAEVASIGRTNHHNIVRLVGFCWEQSNRLLVYEYMERGSLDRWIFQPGSKSEEDGGAGSLLDWPTRYNVALGMARGLSYLHDECTEPILHFDIKPQNILLDDAFEAKLADFGMSRLMQRDISHVVTDVRGTPGYIAPEWLSHGVVSKKCDVYSMGMVMMEIIGGRKNCDFSLLNSQYDYNIEWHFPSWAAKMCEEGMMMELVDKRLQGDFDEEQAQRFIKSAFWCIQEDPSTRPYAHTVVQWLEGSSHVKPPPFSVAVPVQSRVQWSTSQGDTSTSLGSTSALLEHQGR